MAGSSDCCHWAAKPDRLQSAFNRRSLYLVRWLQMADSVSSWLLQEPDLRHCGPAGQTQLAATLCETRSLNDLSGYGGSLPLG